MLEVGLLWFDADRRRTARDKLEQAAARYQLRFARRPNVCQVHPADLFSHESIAVVPNPAVLRDHFWVGVDRDLEPPPAPPRRRGRPAEPRPAAAESVRPLSTEAQPAAGDTRRERTEAQPTAGTRRRGRTGALPAAQSSKPTGAERADRTRPVRSSLRRGLRRAG